MYRIWYEILIKKACRLAKGITAPRKTHQHSSRGKQEDALVRLDECLDAWAGNLSEALSTPFPEGIKWSPRQYEDVYEHLYRLVHETWLAINRDRYLGRTDRKQTVESVVREW